VKEGYLMLGAGEKMDVASVRYGFVRYRHSIEEDANAGSSGVAKTEKEEVGAV
jgi:hypothetical protein